MIFDSKRRQASEAEAETATLAAAPVAPDEVQTRAPIGANRSDQGTYLEDEPVIARTAADVRTDSRLTEGAFGSPADRVVEPQGSGRDQRADTPVRRGDNSDALEPLFAPDVAEQFRRSWDAVQLGFVDDPRQAVKKADELVQQVLHNLTESFCGERSRAEGQGTQSEASSTEDLRVALRRDRAFLERLLSL